MPRTPEVDRLDRVLGNVLALKAAVLALIATHPNAEEFRGELEGATQISLAKLEPTQASTPMIEGFQDMATSLQSFAAKQG